MELQPGLEPGFFSRGNFLFLTKIGEDFSNLREVSNLIGNLKFEERRIRVLSNLKLP